MDTTERRKIQRSNALKPGLISLTNGSAISWRDDHAPRGRHATEIGTKFERTNGRRGEAARAALACGSANGWKWRRAPRNWRPDGEGVRTPEPSGCTEACSTECGQARHRWDDGGRTARTPARALAAPARGTSRGALPAAAGETGGDSKARRGRARARHPDGARSVHPAAVSYTHLRAHETRHDL